jgi:L-alanine-DL-glutamate epimerase-like enolase superfamily enzyme
MSSVVAVRAATATLPLPAPLRLGPLEIHEREYAAVEVETDDGLVGTAYCLTRGAPVAACVERLVAPVVTGHEAEPRSCWEAASRATSLIGRTGLVVRALGLVDVALWDVAAQAQGVPLWSLLGAAAPRSVPVMMVAAYPLADRTPESLAEDVLRHAEAGYPLLKIARDADASRLRRLLGAVVAALPGEARLVVDASFAWRDAGEALAELPAWGDVPLAWLEDPVVPEDAEGCAEIRREGPHPLGVGDEVTHIATFQALLDAEALDVLRLDVMAIGGVTPALRVLALAASHGLPVSFHVYPEVSAQLACVSPGSMIEIFDPHVPGGNPLDPAHLLYRGGPAFVQGMARLPDAAGLGAELDRERFFEPGATRGGGGSRA